MAGKVLELDQILTKDQLGCKISELWMTWNMLRQDHINQKREVREYVYATDTTQTSNAQLPWSNKTTLPKLTQIRDNLYANYIATMFPKRRWLTWEGQDRKDETKRKIRAIKDYMTWVVNQREFKREIEKLVLDYIDWGNCFATVEWVDETKVTGGVDKIGYVGPRIVRISPLDLVMNPVAPEFKATSKIVRVITGLGEAKEMLQRFSLTEQDRMTAEATVKYLQETRRKFADIGDAQVVEKDDYFSVDGFTSFRDYINSDYVELLFFYGDIYDKEKDTFLKDRMIVVADRHKLLVNIPHPYPLAGIPIYHAGWRVRQDNLWAMGPLDNLVGLQYRLDHVENMKSDIMDLTAFPPLKIKGMVNGDFVWGPMEKIYVDGDGDVELMTPDVNVLQNNIEIASIEQRMEEMAGSPKEAMGFRTPGEKTAYEVQRLENAASRIFQNKISQFEEQIIEPLLNACLVLAQQHLDDVTIRVLEDEFRSVDFRTITKDQISANGQIKPIAARSFAEKAEIVQNLTNFYSSAIGADPEIKAHFSTVKLAQMMEELLDIERYEIVEPYVRLSEQSEAQQLANTHQEDITNTAAAPAGLTPEDFSGP